VDNSFHYGMEARHESDVFVDEFQSLAIIWAFLLLVDIMLIQPTTVSRGKKRLHVQRMQRRANKC
jgi:hypothetical protein